MAKPLSVFSSEMVAVTSMRAAVRPAAPSCPDNAMAKQPACAAASSSSGLVPTPFSKRVANEYCVLESTPLAVDTAPLPCLRSPCQTADALRFMNPPNDMMQETGDRSQKSEVRRQNNVHIGLLPSDF